jgi:hypothetical protein
MLLSLGALLLVACGQPSAPPAVPAPAPPATLLPGWKRIEGKGVSIALPDTFVGGDFSSADQDMLIASLEKMGSDFGQLVEMIKSNPELYLLFGLDPAPASSGVSPNVNIVHEKVLSVIDPETYMKALGKQMPAQFKVTSQENITLFGEPAGKMLIEATLANKAMKEVM